MGRKPEGLKAKYSVLSMRATGEEKLLVRKLANQMDLSISQMLRNSLQSHYGISLDGGENA